MVSLQCHLYCYCTICSLCILSNSTGTAHMCCKWPLYSIQVCYTCIEVSVDWYDSALQHPLLILTTNLESLVLLESSRDLVMNIKGRGKTFLALGNVVLIELLFNLGTSADAAPYHGCLPQKKFIKKLCQKNAFYSHWRHVKIFWNTKVTKYIKTMPYFVINFWGKKLTKISLFKCISWN